MSIGKNLVWAVPIGALGSSIPNALSSADNSTLLILALLVGFGILTVLVSRGNGNPSKTEPSEEELLRRIEERLEKKEKERWMQQKIRDLEEELDRLKDKVK